MSWNEADYRRKAQETFEHIEGTFESVDPDVAECEVSLGALTVTLADRSRLILSLQPAVRQLWLAIAARATAHHFDYVPEKDAWLDDKGRGIELFSFMKTYFQETCGLNLDI